MFVEKHRDYFLFIICFIILIVAWLLQSNLFINWDSSVLMREAQLLLTGGNYGSDFLEINPPMCIYLYILPVVLTKIFPINMILALRLYVFVICSLSLFVCYGLLQKIFSIKDTFLFFIFFSVLLTVFLIFPVTDFSEREHLILVLTVPYFFAFSARLQGNSLGSVQAIMVGVLAGIGFAIKPFFLITFFFLEIYYIVSTKNKYAWVRKETTIIILLLFVYLLSVVLFYKSYINFIIPLVSRFYYASIQDSYREIILYPCAFFCYYIAALFFLVQNKENPYKVLSTVLFIALIGYLFAYFIQQTAWSYHLLPANSVAILLASLLFCVVITRIKNNQREYWLTPILMVVFFAFPIYVITSSLSNGLAYKNDQANLITFFKKYAQHKSICSFQASIAVIFPAVDYANVNFPCRNLALIWMPNTVRQTKIHPNIIATQQLQHDEAIFINMISEDLTIHKPDFILVDVLKQRFYSENISFSYLEHLLKNKQFQIAWKNYSYFTTVSKDVIYKFDVYQRK